jgi:hypothetical protein
MGQEAESGLGEERRKELFRLLVVAQDHQMSVPESRRMVGERFGVAEDEVRRIEREGIAGRWPPL